MEVFDFMPYTYYTRMTVARQGSPILDPDLRSQPLRGCARHPLSGLRRTSPCSGGRIDFYAFLQRHGSMAKHP